MIEQDEEREPHKWRSLTGPVHAWDCPPCIADAILRAARDEQTNPHRPGTKAWAKRQNDDAACRWGVDPRGETYWSS